MQKKNVIMLRVVEVYFKYEIYSKLALLFYGEHASK